MSTLSNIRPRMMNHHPLDLRTTVKLDGGCTLFWGTKRESDILKGTGKTDSTAQVRARSFKIKSLGGKMRLHLSLLIFCKLPATFFSAFFYYLRYADAFRKRGAYRKQISFAQHIAQAD